MTGVDVIAPGNAAKPCALKLANILDASEGSIVRTCVGKDVENGANTVTVTVSTSPSLSVDCDSAAWVAEELATAETELLRGGTGVVGKARESVLLLVEKTPPSTPVDWNMDRAADSVVQVSICMK